MLIAIIRTSLLIQSNLWKKVTSLTLFSRRFQGFLSLKRPTLEKSILETLIYITNSVDETKLSCNTSTAVVTVSLKTYPLFTIVRRGRREKLALGLGCFHLLSSNNVWVIQNSYLGKPSSLLWRLILELKHAYSFLSILDAAVKMVSCHGSPILNASQEVPHVFKPPSLRKDPLGEDTFSCLIT